MTKLKTKLSCVIFSVFLALVGCFTFFNVSSKSVSADEITAEQIFAEKSVTDYIFDIDDFEAYSDNVLPLIAPPQVFAFDGVLTFRWWFNLRELSKYDLTSNNCFKFTTPKNSGEFSSFPQLIHYSFNVSPELQGAGYFDVNLDVSNKFYETQRVSISLVLGDTVKTFSSGAYSYTDVLLNASRLDYVLHESNLIDFVLCDSPNVDSTLAGKTEARKTYLNKEVDDLSWLADDERYQELLVELNYYKTAYIELLDDYALLQSDYFDLEKKYEMAEGYATEWELAYTELENVYGDLYSAYEKLTEGTAYPELRAEYDQLLEDYNELSVRYKELKERADYASKLYAEIVLKLLFSIVCMLTFFTILGLAVIKFIKSDMPLWLKITLGVICGLLLGFACYMSLSEFVYIVGIL